MTQRVFLIHQREDEPAAHRMAEEIELAGVRVGHSGTVAHTREGQLLIARAISLCDLVIVLWSDRAANSAPVSWQIERAVHAAVPSLIYRVDGYQQPPPFGLTELPEDLNGPSLRAHVREQLRWSAIEASQPVLVPPTPPVRWRRAAELVLLAAVVAVAGMLVHPASALVDPTPKPLWPVATVPMPTAHAVESTLPAKVLPPPRLAASPAKAHAKPPVEVAAAAKPPVEVAAADEPAPPLPRKPTFVVAPRERHANLPPGRVMQRIVVGNQERVLLLTPRRLRFLRARDDGSWAGKVTDEIGLRDVKRRFVAA